MPNIDYSVEYGSKGRYIVCELDPNKVWCLCVIDDNWRHVYDYLDRTKPFDADGRDTYIEKMSSGDKGCQVRGLIAVTYYAPRLSNLGCLIVGDFPDKDRGNNCIDYTLEKKEYSEKSFLIDVFDVEGNDRAPSILEKLNSKGIPKERCAKLTVGGSREQSVEPIYKCDIFEDIKNEYGGELLEWWNNVQGHIHDGYFNRITSERNSEESNNWHDPSAIPLSLDGEESFSHFLSQLAQRDRVYRVWSWVLEVLSSEATEIEKRYTYLCGKSYQTLANNSRIPFTGLRGFVHGLSRKYDVTIDDNTENPNIRRVDNPYCKLGYCTANDRNLNHLAKSVVNYIDKLHKEGEEFLKSIRVERNEAVCQVELQFTGVLPDEIFEGKEDPNRSGRVHQAWMEVSRCIGTGIKRRNEDGETVVCFRFSHRGRKL